MHKVYKILSVILLLFNLTGALYGGTNLILHPDGSSMELSLDLLKYTPFKNYFIPGILLLIANGLFCAYVLWTVLKNNKTSGRLIIAQGIILTGWIIIQVLLIRTVFYLHYVLGSVGISLIILGWLQNRFQKNEKTKTHD